MTPELPEALRKLLAGGPGGISVEELAGCAARECEKLVRHLARHLGDLGVQTLFGRCLKLAAAQFPWLVNAKAAPGTAGDEAWSLLRAVMEQQDPETIVEAFVLVLSTFIGLLERLIGEGLVERLLHEVWPTVFRT